jgi:cytochrome c biogenesis protein CcmG/thiol:disulfide interchange protein DsbE
MKKLVIVIMLAAAAAAGACASTKGREENAPAPDFSVKNLQGQTVSLADYRGKVLVLNFWATWCPPCRAEIPDFIESYKSLKDKGLEILGFSVDSFPPERLAEWTGKAGINYPVALATREVLEAYQPGDFIPATILIDGKGRIRYRHVGVMDKETLAQLFKEYSD